MRHLILLFSFLCLSVSTAFGQPYAYVANLSSDNVSVLDIGSNMIVSTIPVGINPLGVATDANNNRVFVANQGGSVSVIDATINTVSATIPNLTQATGVALSPDVATLYVTTQAIDSLAVINTSDNSIVATVLTGDRPFGVAVSPDGSLVYVANIGGNSVTVVDAMTNTATTTITVGIDPQGVVFNPAGTKAYVANSLSNTVSVIDVATSSVSNTIMVGNFPRGVAIGGSEMNKLYVTTDIEGSVNVVNLDTEMVESTISIAGGMTGIAATADGSTLYATNRSTNQLYTIDPATNMSTGNIAIGNGPISLGNFILDNTTTTLPGDNCGIAIDINSLFGQTPGEAQTSEEYDNEVYNDDPSDPNENVCFGDWANTVVKSTWFSFTGDGSSYTIESTGNFDPFIALYSGGCDALTEVNCNDDTDGLNFSIEIETEAGVDYHIYVGRASTLGTSTLFNLEVTRAALPGDQCDIAIDINSLFGQAEMTPQLSDTYDNTGYNPSPNDMPGQNNCFAFISTGNNGTNLQPFWFAFTGDGNRYTINSTGNLDIVGTLFTGDCDNLTEVDCDNSGANFSLDFQTEAGVEYLLIVSRFSGGTGEFNIEITNQGTVGVQDIQETAIQLFPNPTTGFFKLQGVDATRVLVFDQLGRQVARFEQPAEQQMDIQALPAGVYVLRIEDTEGQVFSARVVKE